MRKITRPSSVDFHAETPLTTAPKIMRSYDSDGVRLYETERGIYFADMYDKAFGVGRGIVNRNAKDINPAAIHNLNF